MFAVGRQRANKSLFAFSEWFLYWLRGAFAVCSGGCKRRSKAEPMAYSPQHIANYFLDQAEAEGRPMEQMKLIKLVYIAYGWFLALKNEKLFDEPIQAWDHGPVIPSIYHEFKHYRGDPIHERSAFYDLDTSEFIYPDVEPTDLETRDVLSKVWAAYRGFSGWSLRNKTHQPGTPWTDTYEKGVRNKVIPDHLIAQHFAQKIGEILDAVDTAEPATA
jgi:uncharacterized phage-associated protein